MSNPRWLNGRAKAGPIRNFGRRAYLNGMSEACDSCFPRGPRCRAVAPSLSDDDAYIIVLLRCGSGPSVLAQSFDGPPRLSGLAVLRPFCNKPSRLVSTDWVFAFAGHLPATTIGKVRRRVGLNKL